MRTRKRVAVGLVGLTLALAVYALPSPAGAVAQVNVTRYGGVDRFDTAARISQATFPNGSQNVIVAVGGAQTGPGALQFADALAGSALAGQLRAPVLLTQTNAIPATTATELTRLRSTNIYILGGTDVVSVNVENALRTAGRTVTRIAGDTRYSTAAAIARQIGSANIGSLGGQRTAFLVTGEQFADALAAGPGAFARSLPVLLTEPGRLRPEAETAIRELGIQQLIIAGGVAAVSANTEAAVQAVPGVRNVQRFGGANRQETAARLGTFFLGQDADLPTFDGVDVSLARGDDFADALAGAPHAGTNGAPIILAESPTVLGTATANFLSQNFATVTNLFIYGGVAAISEAVATQAQVAAQTPTTPPTGVNVTPADTVTLAQNSSRSYTATVRTAEGAPFTGQVIIRVLDFVAGATPTALVPNGAGGRGVVFLSTVNGGQGGIATPTATTATVFGGVAGQVNFVLTDNTDAAPSDAIPQVVLDLNGNGQVDAGEPSGLGGGVIFAAAPPTEAAAGAANVTVTSVTATGNSFAATVTAGTGVGGTFTFDFDSTDVFTVPQVGSVDLNTFRQRLNAGDQLSVNYNPDPAGQSLFTITNDLANAPLTVTTPNVQTTVDANTFTIAGTGQPGFSVTAYRDLQNNNAFDPFIDPSAGGPVTVNPDGTYAVSVTLTQGTATAPAPNDFVVVQRPAGSTANPSDTTTAGLDVEAVARILESPTPAFTFTANAVNNLPSRPAELSAQDVITLNFTGSVATPTAGASISVRDEDGTTATLTNGGNANFVRADADTYIVTITGLTGATGGALPNLLQAPVAITAITGVTSTPNAAGTTTPAAVGPNGVLIGGSY